MTRIALVVSDVDGTLLTRDKTLTDGARRAVRRLHEAGIGFTITSSRPIIGMGFLIEPLAITLPVGAFNGSCIVDPQLNPIELHLTVPISGCSPLISGSRAGPMANTSRTKSARSGPIQTSLRILRLICRLPARSSAQAPMQSCCNAAKSRCSRHWVRRPPPCGRKAIISTSRHRAATKAPSCRRSPNVLVFRPERSPPSATCRTIWRCLG